jgi:uncharacterized OB-fold protein
MFTDLDSIFIILTAFALAFILALWISLIIWTLRDIRLRTKDRLFRFLALLSVIVFNFPGFLIYLILRPRSTFSESYQSALEEEALLQSIDGFDTCPACGHQTNTSWNYCPFCEQPLQLQCKHCGGRIKPEWNACPECGTAVVEAENEAKAESEIVEISVDALAPQSLHAEQLTTDLTPDEEVQLEEEEFDSFQDD